MATDYTPHPAGEEREDDRLLDIWLFTLFALGVLIFLLFTAPRGCGDALREKESELTTITLPDGTARSLQKGSFNYGLARFLASKDDGVVPRTFVFDHLNFEFGAVQLTADSVPTVNDLAAILKAYPSAKVRLEGYTDNVGDAGTNRVLSFNRAESVKAFLVKNGIAANRLSTGGYGQDKPLASNETEEGRAKNRRLELVVLRK